MMKKPFVNRKITGSIFVVMLLMFGVQGVSYAQNNTPTVAPGDTNTSLRVSFIDVLYTFDENAYQVQLRRKIPQGNWITNCVDISYRGKAGRIEIYTHFHDLEPGVTYEARYRDTNEPDCIENPPSPDPWSAIGQGTTLLESPPVAEFVDTTLAIVVRRTLRLDLANGVDILKIRIAELSKLKTLLAGKASTTNELGLPVITDLTGLEHATQLITLYLRGQDVTDLAPLTRLTQLTNIDLWGNRIVDITPLAPLTQLIELNLGGPRTGNDIVDISPLAQLTQLRKLGLGNNEISNISPLAGLMELRELNLPFNRISDISPLAQLTELTNLTLGANQVSDISPLTQLTNLTLLGLTTNQIKDITPIAQMKQLTFLQLGYNQIRDITPLGQAESLTKLYLDHNHIRDLSPLATLTQLTTLDLASNQISDVTPLAQLSKSLEALDLRDNRIRDVTPLASLIYLEKLSLRDNPITDTFPLSALLDENPDLDIDIEVIREVGGPTLAVSTFRPLTVATLNGDAITLRLSSGAFGLRTEIRDALTISGITGITFHWTDIDRVSDTEITIKLTFTGSINKDTKLIFTFGPGAIRNYNGPALTAEILVSATTEVTKRLIASTPVPLTAANLHGSVVTLTLGQERYNINWNWISQNVMISGIDGVTFKRHNVERVNDVQVTIQLEFSGNLDTDSILTFTVGAKAIADYDGPELTAELPVTVSTTTETPTGPKEDVNGDGIVNIQDLVLVASNLGKTGQNAADVNGDGQVNIQDLVLVAGALGATAAAPSLHPQSQEMLTAVNVKHWLSQAQHLNLTDDTSLRGIQFLQDLLATLTPKETALLPNYPNPFNPETWIPYHLAKDADVALTIYAVNGTLVRTLALGHQAAGIYHNRSHAAYWDGRNEFGEPVASGVYFYALTAGDFTATRKMLIRK